MREVHPEPRRHRRRPAGRASRRGSIQPVVLALTLLLMLVSMLILHSLQQSILMRRATQAAEALALAAMMERHPEEYTSPGLETGHHTPDPWDQLVALAEHNGIRGPFFESLQPTDIAWGHTSVEVTIRSRFQHMSAVQARAVGVPAARILAGRRRLDATGRPVGATGCLPLGVRLNAIPAAADATPFRLELGAEDAAASMVMLPGSVETPSLYARYLGNPSAEPIGLPPPEVRVGDAVEPKAPTDAFLQALAEDLAGRVVIVPLVHDREVLGFGRMRLEAVNVDPPTVQFRLSPSAVSRAAGAVAAADRPPTPPEVSPRGLVLELRLEG